MIVNKINFQTHDDEQGKLISIEECKDIPFEIRRIYYMYNNIDGVARGHHAHKSLKQVLVCVHGSCKICLDDGREKEVVLLVLASDFYDEADYIKDYDDFLKFVNC